MNTLLCSFCHFLLLKAVNDVVHDNMVVGIGSGSTVVFAVQRIAERVAQENLKLRCVPTSYQALQLIREHNLVLTDLSADPVIDVTIDGVDELNWKTLDCIKGGGGCHVQEKIVASCSKRLVLICDGSKQSDYLGQKWRRGVPVEVIPMAVVPLCTQLKQLRNGNPVLRMAKAKAGPLVTDNGNFIIDIDFGADFDVPFVNDAIIKMVGVVETGLFIGMAQCAYIGHSDRLEILKRNFTQETACSQLTTRNFEKKLTTARIL